MTDSAHGKADKVGVLFVDDSGRIIFSHGRGNDSRVRVLIEDKAWLKEAAEKHVYPIRLTDEMLVSLVTPCDGGHLIMLSHEPVETVQRFLMNVDFAYDIINLILTDPYDAMVVIDDQEKVSFISPVHEKFFGLGLGEAVGKHIREVIPNSRLPHCVRTGVAEVGQLLRLKDGDRVVSRHPIRHQDRIVGAIGRIMFKGPQQVEELSRQVNSLEQQIAQFKAEADIEKRGEKYLDAIIGKSLAIESVRQQIRKIAPLDVPVLIQGESGTGKELVAQALHMLSHRHSGRLVTVNAAALPATLVESELFGFEAGSFTGADRKGRAGKFELADKGTIFLDEIGDMPLEVQSKLLRVLQDRIVERVGGDKAKHVDFRLCSATNHDLQRFVEEKQFRLDLFYRISPVCIVLPSLAERLEDIPLLLQHFVSEMASRYGRPAPEIDMNVPDFLMEKEWPGNIRQLRHEVERAVVFSELGRLTVEDFLKGVSQSGTYGAKRVAPAPASDGSVMKAAIEQLEGQLIIDAMGRFKSNKKRVAEYLGVSRSYLYKKLEEVDADMVE